jgi:hypothetical protein
MCLICVSDFSWDIDSSEWWISQWYKLKEKWLCSTGCFPIRLVTFQQAMKFPTFKEVLLQYLQSPEVPKFLLKVCNMLVCTVVSQPPKPLNWRTIFFRPSATYSCIHRYPSYLGPSSLAGELIECHGLVTRYACGCSQTHKFWENNPNKPARFVTTRCDSPCVIVFTFQATYLQSL